MPTEIQRTGRCPQAFQNRELGTSATSHLPAMPLSGTAAARPPPRGREKGRCDSEDLVYDWTAQSKRSGRIGSSHAPLLAQGLQAPPQRACPVRTGSGSLSLGVLGVRRPKRVASLCWLVEVLAHAVLVSVGADPSCPQGCRCPWYKVNSLLSKVEIQRVTNPSTTQTPCSLGG